MQLKKKVINSCLITAVSLCGIVACNNGDYKTADDKIAADSSANSNNSATANNASKDNPSTKTAGIARRKGKTSVTMPHNENGTMTKDREGVYDRVQVMPEYPGGQDALASYVNDHLDYTQQAIDQNTSGTVKISFVIDEEGKVIKAHLSGNDKLGNGLDEEALKVVGNMPAWKPGKVKGRNVKTRLELPITFQLES